MDRLLLLIVALGAFSALLVAVGVGGPVKDVPGLGEGLAWVGWVLLVGGGAAASWFGRRCEARGDAKRDLRDLFGPEAGQARWELAASVLGLLAAFLGGGLVGGLLPYWLPL